MERISYLLSIFVVVFLIYFLTKQIFNFILRGFAPFIVARPWVIDSILQELKKMNLRLRDDSVVYSIGSGRSGLLYALEQNYPQATFIGVEDSWWSSLLSRIQLFLRKSKIKVLNQKNTRHLDFKNADLIYCKLDVERLRDIDNKLKFECKPGAIIISNGFNVPSLDASRVIELDDKKGKFSFLSKDRSFWKRKSKKSKKENKIYFYEV